MKFQITNTKSGADLGLYEADTAETAGLAMLRDAGYPNATVADLDSDLVIAEVAPVTVNTNSIRGWDFHAAIEGTWEGPRTDAANDEARALILDALRKAGASVDSEDLSVLDDGTWELDAFRE